MNRPEPVTEADLHAWVDGQLSAERAREIDVYLSTRPDEAERLAAYRAQGRELHALFDPVLDEPVPRPVLAAARRPQRAARHAIAAAVVAALLGGAGGWVLRGSLAPAVSPSVASGVAFAQRAAVAHAVYSPDVRRPVEVSAAQEDQLVTWLSRRMGTPMKPPHLQELGYALEGGRLLPGGRGPVAQFMYHDASGARLTLYVSNDVAVAGHAGSATTPAEPAFRFSQESGGVNVFYWVEGRFGYALSASLPRAELARVAAVVYRDWRTGR
ncbi:anti-sigma factor family protein [Piscinibacter koreensis]|uniref:Anti-sigma factor n=1 Tax=Piscinibacter koreensis TaxID=2742824 RepID=A0A7Y6TUZ8_9BURK|nr:anti-sigma factor [Schlegelella koreensis]NUZ04503.1 anti-sigma factor [Schlegelella koreensis]